MADRRRLVWTVGVIVAGCQLGTHIHKVDHYRLPVIAVIIVISVIPIGLEALRVRRRSSAAT